MGCIDFCVCVIWIFATFEIRCCLIRELRYHFQQVLHQYLYLKILNIFKFIALAVLEIVKTLYVALEISLSIMYVSREVTIALYKFELFKKRVVWFAGSRVLGRTPGLPGTMHYL